MIRKRDRVLNVRLTEEEATMVAALAEYDGFAISSWVRHVIRESFRVRLSAAKTASPRKRG
jgi:hypothetical protein